MSDFKKMALEAETPDFSDYLNLAKALERRYAGSVAPQATLRAALLSSFTTKGLSEVLRVKCCQSGVWPEIYNGGYNQYFQEILNEGSALYAFNPEIVFLFIDSGNLLGEVLFTPYSLTDQERKLWCEEKAAELEALVLKLKQNSQAAIVIHNFEVPCYSPAGILEAKKDFGQVEAVEWINTRLREFCKGDSRLHLLDYNAFCSAVGKQQIRDEKMYYLGDLRLAWHHMPALAEVYMGYIKPLKALSKKCVVLDLDNTLWGGVVGEDGFNGIHLGPSPEGRSFWEFQKALLALYQRGILLAVNSKNNEADALEVIRNHPHMVLREEHFAALRINWEDKVSNLKDLAAELNLGLDSFVFLDDDKMQRGMVRALLPEVLTVEMPEDPALYLKTLQGLNDFNALQLTDEDLRRGQLYASERQRRTFKQTAGIEDYLHGLETVLTIEPVNAFSIPRIAQLTQRTNQFNMTTRRYQEEDVTRMSQSPAFLVLSLNAKDRFGDNGLTAAAVIEKKSGRVWRIDSFMMSCRIIGRKIEEAFLAHILQRALAEGVQTVTADFVSTEKNALAKGFYEKCGFQPAGIREGIEIFDYELKTSVCFPKGIRLEGSEQGVIK